MQSLKLIIPTSGSSGKSLRNPCLGTTFLAICLAACLISQVVSSHGNDPNCGLKGTGPGQPKLGIRNGTAVKSATQYPWQAQLVFVLTPTTGQICGASILNPDWLLTAAHCVCQAHNAELLAPLSSFHVVAGSVDASPGAAPHQRSVALVVRHPGYQAETATVDRFINDVALVKLDKSLDLSVPELGSICLPPKQSSVDSFAGRSMTLTGFGSVTNERTPGARVLRQLTAAVAPQSQCRPLLAGAGKFSAEGADHVMCWGDAAHGGCVGDSGGPLVARDGQHRWYQYGIASFGNGVAVSAANQADVGACRNSFMARTSDYSAWVWEEIARH